MNRRMQTSVGAILALMALLVSVATPWAEEPEEVNTGDDFTRTVTRFDLRFEYQDLPKDSTAKVMTAREDKLVEFPKGWEVGLRMDIPYEWSDQESKDNPKPPQNQNGFGDILAQAIVSTPEMNDFTGGIGLRLYFPTAAKDQMGKGRYRADPMAGGKYHVMKDVWVALLLRQDADIGGDRTRSIINRFYIQPYVHLTLPRLWTVDYAPEFEYDWLTSQWFIPFDIRVGKMLTKKNIISVEYWTNIQGENPSYNWQIEFRVGHFF